MPAFWCYKMATTENLLIWNNLPRLMKKFVPFNILHSIIKPFHSVLSQPLPIARIYWRSSLIGSVETNLIAFSERDATPESALQGKSIHFGNWKCIIFYFVDMAKMQVVLRVLLEVEETSPNPGGYPGEDDFDLFPAKNASQLSAFWKKNYFKALL